MVYIKFKDHWPFGSWDFQRFLPYMGMVAILVMWPRHYEQIFVPPPDGSSTCNLVSTGLAVSEMSFENVDTDINADTDDGPQPTL